MKLFSPTISGSLVASSSQQFIGITVQTGSLIASGSQQFIGTQTVTGSLIVSQSSTIIGTQTITGSIIVSQSVNVVGTQTITGYLIVSQSSTIIGTQVITGSLIASSSQQFIGITNITGSLISSGSQQFIGNTNVTGSLIVTGSTFMQAIITGSAASNNPSASILSIGGSITPTGSLSGSSAVLINPVMSSSAAYQTLVALDISPKFTGSSASNLALSVSGSQRFIGFTYITGSLIVSGTENLTTQTRLLPTAHFQSGLEVVGFQSPANQYPTSSITFSGSLYVIANTASYHIISGGIILAGNLVPAISASMFATTTGKITSSYTLGTPQAVWKAIYVQNKSIHIMDPDTGDEINTLTAKDPIPKDPANPANGFWYPLNSLGSQTVTGDFNILRVPANFVGSRGAQYSPVRKGTRTGIGYQALYNSTQLGDADAGIKGGLGITLNNWNQSLEYSLNYDASGSTRPDLQTSGLTGSGLFETDITFPYAPNQVDSTASLIIPTSSLLGVINGTETLILKGNSELDQPDLAFYDTNNPPIGFRISGSSLPYGPYWKDVSDPAFLGGGPKFPTFYSIVLADSQSKFENFVNMINSSAQYMNSGSFVSSSYWSGYGKLAMSASISGGNLVLKSIKSGSYANNYFAWAPSFTESLPLFFDGGHTHIPGLAQPAKLLFNDTQDTGLYKYGMGIRVLAYTEKKLKPAVYVELGDFNHLNNRTRFVIDDRYGYLHLSASTINIGQSGSTTNIGNNATTNIGTAENSTVNIATAETEAIIVTIGSSRNQGRNRFFGNATSADNGGVTQIVAGTNVFLSPTNGKGNVTISSIGGGGGTGSLGGNVSSSFVSSSLWTFTHGLGNKGVIVQTFDINWNQILPQVLTLVDNNTVTIQFPASQSGYAIASLGGNTNISHLATTGSNKFSGNQTITGSLYVTGSTTLIGSTYIGSPQIGTSYQGGIIAYILQPNDIGYDANFYKGFVAAPTDTSTSVGWGCSGTDIATASGSAIGTGASNTAAILAGCATRPIAASVTSGSINGYTDWYLPSISESIAMYNNIGNGASGANYNIGNFVNTLYWSSTQVSSTNAQYLIFTNGAVLSNAKGLAIYVRAIRNFSIPKYALNVNANTNLTGSVNISGSTTIIGTTVFRNASTTITGSLLVSGSTTQIGNNTLLGNTTLSGSIIISGSTIPGSTTASVQIYGDIRQTGYHRFDPVTTNIDTSTSASYIYVSGSTNDLYFSQNGSGYSNTSRLRWLEGGSLYTGLLRGGIISSIPGTTTFNITSGSGLLVTMNASTASEPFPTVNYISWPNFTSQPIQNSGSAKITYVGIDSSGQIIQQVVPWGTNDINQWDNSLALGVVLHLSGSVSTGVFNSPQISYGQAQKADDFFRAFGPLKLSGHTIQASGSTLSLTKLAGTSYREGANYTINPNHPSTVVENSISVSKIYRYYLSGSTPIIDTGAGAAGYTVIDPTQRVDTTTGNLTSVANNKYSLQRVFWIPNSPTNAFIVYYGNAEYSSLIDAVAAKDTEPFAEAPNTAQNAIFLGYIAVAGGATNLTTAADATIIQAGLFRNVGGIGSGGTNFVSTTLAGLSDVSITSPANNQLLAYNSSTTRWNNVSSITASLAGTASWANNSVTASYFSGSISNATSASYALTASYALNGGGGSSVTIKAGSGSVASFAGSPYISSITFASAFSNNLYAVIVTGEDARSWTVQSKSSAGFTINSNSSVALTGPVYWIATPFN